MAVKSVKLKIGIKLADGKRPYVNPVYEAKGRLKPLWARGTASQTITQRGSTRSAMAQRGNSSVGLME